MDPANARRTRFPWLIFLLLLASIYGFWVLPRQLGPRPVKVEFGDDRADKLSGTDVVVGNAEAASAKPTASPEPTATPSNP